MESRKVKRMELIGKPLLLQAEWDKRREAGYPTIGDTKRRLIDLYEKSRVVGKVLKSSIAIPSQDAIRLVEETRNRR